MQQKILLQSSLMLALTLAFSAHSNHSQDENTVIVYGQRVERDIIEVPVSMDVVSEEQIERLRLGSVADVVKTIPNISMPDIAGDYSYIQVRGMPRHLEQTNVPVYVDGVPHTSMYGLNLPLMDVENIEFLRGPQGNLFGSNARDGVIVITTKKPSNETTAQVSVGVANYGQKSIKAGVSTPLVDDELLMKLSISALKRDGFVQNTHLNKSIDHKDDMAANLGLYWQLNEKVSARLSLDYMTKDLGPAPYANTTNKTMSRGDDLEAAMDIEGTFEQSAKGVSLGVDWHISPDWTLSSVTGYRQQNVYAKYDPDLVVSPPAMAMYIDNWFDEKDYFQEFRLTSTPKASDFDWLFGLAYFRATDDNRQAAHIIAMQSDMTRVASELARDTYTAYVDSTWRFAPSWRLNLGARFTQENFDSNSNFYNAFAGGDSQGSYNTNYNKFLPKAALTKEFGKDHNVYASYGEGLLSGGATWMYENVTPEQGRTGQTKPYAPETSRVFELGYKAYWLDRTMMTNLAVFDSYVYNYQLPYADAMGNAKISSVNKVRSRGLEGSVNAWIADAWEAVLGFGFNDAKVEEIDGYSGATLAKGSRIPFAPKYNIHSHVVYNGNISNDWQFIPSLSVNYFGDVLLNGSGSITQDPYALINANLEFVYRHDYSIRVWGSNLADERYRTQAFNFGNEVSTFGDPRQFGVDFTVRY